MKTATKPKKRYTRRDWEKECEDDARRLRNYLGRLISSNTEPGGTTHDYKPQMTFRMFCIMLRIDHAMVGTPDYMGLAGFWTDEGQYKHTLREATSKQRKKIHDAMLEAGLPLDGASPEHAAIIAWALGSGPRPAKHKEEPRS